MWLPTVLTLFMGVAPDLYSQHSLNESFSDTRAVEPSHCSQGFMVDKNIISDDILMVLEEDLHHCQLACTQNPGCSYFSYYGKAFQCYQKYSDGEPTMTNYTGITSGYTRKGCEKEKVTKQSTVRISLKSNSGADLNDPVVKEQMLEQIRKEFAKNGNFIHGLSWRELPNGDVFRKTVKLGSPEEDQCGSG